MENYEVLLGSTGPLELPDGSQNFGIAGDSLVPQSLEGRSAGVSSPAVLVPLEVSSDEIEEILPDEAGYDPGTEMDLWSINPETGEFERVGTGEVSADGSTINTVEGGIRNSSWHFFTPPPELPTDPEDNPRNQDDESRCCEMTAPGTSEVELHSGAVLESHDLVPYQSLGASRGLTLSYDSLRADPRPILHFGYANVQADPNRRLVAELAISRGDFEFQVPGFAGGEFGLDGGEHFWSLPRNGGPADAALQADLRFLSSGRYDYELTAGLLQLNDENLFSGSTSTSSGQLVHVNRIDSPFGNGWGLAEWQELVENPDGSVLAIDGDGGELLFEASATGDGQFTAIDRYANLAGTQLVTGTDYVYDELNRLTSLTHNNGTDDVAFYNFAYDAASRITQITDIDGVTDYSYDNRNQLTASDRSDTNNPDESYSYDANGNRVSSSIHDEGYETGDGNRLLSDGTFNYEYDNEGNLIRQTEIATGTVRELEWDYRNRLVAVIDKDAAGNETQRVEYTYDGLNRRIAKAVDSNPQDATNAIVTHFVYDGEDVHLEFVDEDGTAGSNAPVLDKRYLHGPEVDQVLAQEDADGTVLWHLSDHLGTVRDLLDNSGAVLNHITYNAFGDINSQTNPTIATRYLFTGREFDGETGLYYYRARYYNSATGSFLSEDPIGFNSGDTKLYGYTFNNPVNFADPSGEIVPLIIGGALIGAAINVGGTLIANGGKVTGRQLLASAASGAISGAIGGIAGPIGGTLAKGLGGVATGLGAKVLTGGVSAIGGALGQTAGNFIDPCNPSSVGNAALFAGLGGFGAAFIPVRGISTLKQAKFFGPKKVSTFLRTQNSRAISGSLGASAGVGSAANFGSVF